MNAMTDKWAVVAIVQIESEASQKEDKYPAYEVYASIEAWVTRMGEGGKSLQNTEASEDYTEQEDRLAAALERIGKDQLTELIWTADPETLARRIVTEVTR